MPIDNQKILVVDDEPQNLKLIQQILKSSYTLTFANDGIKAVQVATDQHPDLILLDIMMPGIDGYEVCRRLKSVPQTKDIPVVFVSSMGEIENQSKGFDLGAIDYIIKPIQPLLLKARVRNHLELKLARDKLVEQNKVLKENLKLREDIESITRHDLKSPLTAIISFPGLIEKTGPLNEKQLRFVKHIKDSGHVMLNMINMTLNMYKMEQDTYQFNPEWVDVGPIINQIIHENRNLIENKAISVQKTINGAPFVDQSFPVAGEPLLIYSMLSNIIKNAIEASPRQDRVALTLENENELSIAVRNQGAIPEEIRDRFFEKYVTSGKKTGTGLGSYSAKLMAKVQRCDVGLETSTEKGTCITFKFPDPEKELPSDNHRETGSRN